MVKRRNFLKGLAVAPAAAPVMMNEALSPLGGSKKSASSGAPMAGSGRSLSPASLNWGDRLKEHLGRSKDLLDHDRREYRVDRIDPGVDSMRSVALHRKVEWTKDIEFEKDRRRRSDYLALGVKGLFDGGF